MNKTQDIRHKKFSISTKVALAASVLILLITFGYKMTVDRGITNVNTVINDMVVSYNNTDKYRQFGCHNCMNIVFDAGKNGSVSSAVSYDLYAKGKYPMYNDYTSKQMGLPLIPAEIDRSPQVHPDYNSDYIFEAMKGEQVSLNVIILVDHINEHYLQIPEKHKPTFSKWQAQAETFKKRSTENNILSSFLTAWHDANSTQDTYFASYPVDTYASIF